MRQIGPGLGQKSLKGSVGITNADGRIRLRWRYNDKRYSLSPSIWNHLNLLQAKKTALQVEQDIITDNFDTSFVN